jgi:hypothetical protein
VIITSAGTAVEGIFRETRIDKNCFTYKRKTQKEVKKQKEKTHDDKEIDILL